MSQQEVTFGEIRAFCQSREVDLRIVCVPPCAFALQGEFDGYGSFFLIEAHDIEHVDFANGLTVGELVLVPDVSRLPEFATRWRHLNGICSGPGLVIRNVDEGRDATEASMSIIVANRFVFRRGRDWGAGPAL